MNNNFLNVKLQQKINGNLVDVFLQGKNGIYTVYNSNEMTGDTYSSIILQRDSYKKLKSIDIGDLCLNLKNLTLYECEGCDPDVICFRFICSLAGDFHFGISVTGTSVQPCPFIIGGRIYKGDFYFNTNTGNLYRCTSYNSSPYSYWSFVCCLRGFSWHTGVAVTATDSSSDGMNVGDKYLNTTTWHLFECTGANTWVDLGCLKGADGTDAEATEITLPEAATIDLPAADGKRYDCILNVTGNVASIKLNNPTAPVGEALNKTSLDNYIYLRNPTDNNVTITFDSTAKTTESSNQFVLNAQTSREVSYKVKISDGNNYNVFEVSNIMNV